MVYIRTVFYFDTIGGNRQPALHHDFRKADTVYGRCHKFSPLEHREFWEPGTVSGEPGHGHGPYWDRHRWV